MDAGIRARLEPERAERSKKELRNFGLIVGSCFAIIAFWPLVRGNPVRVWAVITALCSILPTLIAPRVLQKPYIVWMKIGHILGRINNTILLGILFFLVVTPMAVCMRLFGYDPMSIKKDATADSYKIQAKGRKREHFEEQF